MNFSDFGIKDESELEQDEFSLSRPTFGKDNQLTVIGWKGKSGNNKVYIVKCSECYKDSELFGDGIFKVTKTHLQEETQPCACGKKHHWSIPQYEILIKRVCVLSGYKFIKFVEVFKGQSTKIAIECPKHGIWSTTNIGNFIYGLNKCPRCKYERISIEKSKDDKYHIDRFVSTGKFEEGTKFWKSERVNTRGDKVYWNYTCPVCSNDEYVRAGLCSGIFEGQQSDLSKGHLSCRCSNIHSWTKEQYEYRIKKSILEKNDIYKFIKLSETFKNHKSKCTRFCEKHGEFDTSIGQYLTSGVGCPLCSPQNQQECYINFIKDNGNLIALKFGIAKDSSRRILRQDKESIFSVEQYGVWSFPDVKSCKAAERYVKKHLPCKLLTKSDMPDGFTETTSVDNLEAIIKIYEDFGGVRKTNSIS